MHYKNGKDVLPAELLSEIQQYISGDLIYIPKTSDERAAWGELSGTREKVRNRNINIVKHYKNGLSIIELMSKYCLSEDSIKKIIYNKTFHIK